jgi:hypothetical protein
VSPFILMLSGEGVEPEFFGMFQNPGTAQRAADQWRRLNPHDPRQATVVPVARKDQLVPPAGRKVKPPPAAPAPRVEPQPEPEAEPDPSRYVRLPRNRPPAAGYSYRAPSGPGRPGY